MKAWRKRGGMFLIMLFLTVVGATVNANPAFADICKDAPSPIAPKSGLPGMLTTPPKSIPDQAPDPFTDHSVSIGEVYGFNWKWSNYDLGCGNDFLRDPAAVTNTATGNLVLSMGSGVLASTAGVDQMARTSSIDWLSSVMVTTASLLRDSALGLWFPLALVALGCLVAWKAKSSSYADTFQTLLVVVAAVTLSVFALVYPVKASAAVDKAVVVVAQTAGSQFPETATGAITRESMYRTWLAGNFGNADSPIANEMGPRLMSATHYTWSDMKRMTADPSSKDKIDKAKASEFKAIAKDLEKRDAAAYEVFTGRGERVGPAMLGLIVVLAMSLFIVIAAAMVLVARVMMQGLALVAPLAAVMGMFPSHRAVLAKMWDLFTASLISVAKFVLAGGVMTLILGGIQSADMGSVSKLFWVIVATVVALVLTKPARSLKTILPGLDPNKNYLKDALGKAVSVAGSAVAGGAAGAVVGAVNHPDQAPAPQAETTTSPTTAAGTPSLAALPAPTYAQPVLTATQVPTEQSPLSTPPLAMTDAAQPRRALSAAPMQIESSPRHAEPRAEPSTGPALPDSPTKVTPTEFVEPTGIIIPSRDLYRSDAAPSSGEYVLMRDLELSEDGTEHDQVTYHSDKAAT